MVDPEARKQILAEFDAQSNIYERLAEKIRTLLQELLESHGISVHAITSRIKTRKSLEKKIHKLGTVYKQLSDITDIAGVRIITYLAKDVDRIKPILEEEFDIDVSNSSDKRHPATENQFGYSSLHHVLSLNAARADTRENNRFQALKLEVQTRSILQHAWAEIEHDSGYKSDVEVNARTSRRFARIASLLELADEEFDGIDEEINNQVRAKAIAIEQHPEKVALDAISLKAFIANDPEIRNLEHEMLRDKTPHGQLPDANMVIYINCIQELGVTNFEEIKDLFRKNRELLIAFTDFWLDGPKHYAIAMGISIYYLWLIKVVSKGKNLVHFSVSKEPFPAILGDLNNYSKTLAQLQQNVNAAERRVDEASK